MNDRYEDMYEAARRHFIVGDTMEVIARDMGVSRSTVSRLLTRAREDGIVRVTLAEPRGSQSRIAHEITEGFGIRVHLVEPGAGASPGARFTAVAMRAGEILNTVMTDGMRLGIAWGVTVGQVARHLVPVPLSNVRIVQMNGGAHAQDAGLPYVGAILQTFADAYGARVVPFPVPTFFDFEETKKALWQERSVQRVLAEIGRLDVALFGVGCLHGRVPSHVYASGYLEADQLLAVRNQGAVGDVCTVFLREDGTYSGIDLNQRASGPNPAVLQSVPRRICVVGDPSRAHAVLGALRARVATDLVCDEATARGVVKLL